MSNITVTHHACVRYIERVNPIAKEITLQAQLEYASNMLRYIFAMSKLVRQNKNGSLYRHQDKRLDLLVKNNKIITLVLHRYITK